MCAKTTARHNKLVVEFLQSRLVPAHQSDFSECRLFDSDGSKYLLQRDQESPGVFRLSFSVAGMSFNTAVATSLPTIRGDLQARYQGSCRVSAEEGAYQLKLHILCDSLLGLDPARQLHLLQQIASVRADILCWPLR